MKKNIFFVMLASMLCVATTASAQRFVVAKDATRVMEEKYGKHTHSLNVRHGNNHWLLEVGGALSIDGAMGGTVALKRFMYSHSVGVEGQFLTSVGNSTPSALSSGYIVYAYRFGRPRKVYFEANAGLGVSSQVAVIGTAGELSGDVVGSFLVGQLDYEPGFSAKAGLDVVFKLSDRGDLKIGCDVSLDKNVAKIYNVEPTNSIFPVGTVFTPTSIGQLKEDYSKCNVRVKVVYSRRIFNL